MQKENRSRNDTDWPRTLHGYSLYTAAAPLVIQLLPRIRDYPGVGSVLEGISPVAIGLIFPLPFLIGLAAVGTLVSWLFFAKRFWIFGLFPALIALCEIVIRVSISGPQRSGFMLVYGGTALYVTYKGALVQRRMKKMARSENGQD